MGDAALPATDAGASLRVEPETRGRSLLLPGFCAFLPAFSVSLLVLCSFTSFPLHSWVLFFASCSFYFCCFTCCSCLEAGRLPSPQLLVQTKPRGLCWWYFLPCIRGRWSPITYSQCSHWSAARSRCFTLKVSCVSSKTTLQSVLSRMLKTLLPTAGRFYLLQ